MPQINDGITNAAPRYIDLVKGKLVNGKSVPYDTTAEVLAAIPLTRRAEGNSFLVRNGGNIEEWHFVGGTLDNNLVRKQDVTKTDLTTFNSYKTVNDATVANKVDKTTKIAGKPLSTDITLSKTDISGIDQIDNTSDANKPVSTAQAAALALKSDKTYVDTNLANKANVTDLTNYQSSNDAAVALKANSSDVNTALAAKADTTYVDTGLGNKLDLSKKPVVTNIAGLRTLSAPATDVIYQTTDNGGGQWYHDSTDTTSADNTGTILVTSDSKRLKRIVQGDYMVKWFGALGDGATDETTLLNNIIQSLPEKATLRFEENKVYNISDKIILTKEINIIGNGARLNKTTADGTAISIRSSNVSINGLKINGAGNASYIGYAYLITTDGGSESLFYDNIKIENCTIYNNTSTGIWLSYITNFTIENNTLYDFPYCGIMVISGKRGTIRGNSITNIHGVGTAGQNCYGISASAEGGLANIQNMSSDIDIYGNIIKDIPTWNALDTHGGQNISFRCNKVNNCQWGVAVVGHNYVLKIGSKNILIDGNIITTNSSTNNGSAIRVQGISDTDLTTVVCTNNQCANGFIYLSSTENSVIGSNTIIKPSRGSGIFFSSLNDKVNIIGNVVQDPYDPDGSNTAAILVSGSGTLKGIVEGNILKNTGFVNPINPALIVGSYGFKVFTQGLSKVTFGKNDFSAAVLSEYDLVEQPLSLEGNGSPEGVKTAPVGSTYRRIDGSTGTTFYIKETGTGGNGWIPLSKVVLSKQTLQPIFGANVTTGILDWNDTSNILPGSTETLLLGNATNGPGDANYYHPFNFEYSSKNGSGNITQFAIPYNGAGQAQFRIRYANTWGSWKKLLDTNIILTAGVTTNQYKLSALNTAPASATDSGVLGEIRIDGNYLYFAKAANTWTKAKLFWPKTPTVAVGASFTGTVSVVGDDSAGEVTVNITASTAFATLAEIFTMTFGAAYTAIPSIVFVPSGPLSADTTTNFAGPVYIKGAATTGFSLAAAKAGNSVIGTYKWMYRVN